MIRSFCLILLFCFLGCKSAIIPKYELLHSTSYTFSKPVTITDQIIKLNPFEKDKRILSQHITSETKNCTFIWGNDKYNNKTCTAHVVDTTSGFMFLNTISLDSSQFFKQDYRYSMSDYKDEEGSFLNTEDFGIEMNNFLKVNPIKERANENILLKACSLVYSRFDYTERYEAGVYTTSELLQNGQGACRDLTWFLIQYLRSAHIPARFVSGYLINLESKTADLHAWVEAKTYQGKWVGLDPTSGLFISAFHIPLAIGESTKDVLPIEGMTGKCEVKFNYMSKLVKD